MSVLRAATSFSVSRVTPGRFSSTEILPRSSAIASSLAPLEPLRSDCAAVAATPRMRLSRSSSRAVSSRLAASSAAVSRTGAGAGAGATGAGVATATVGIVRGGPRHIERASSGQYGRDSRAPARTITEATMPVTKAPTTPRPRLTTTGPGPGAVSGVGGERGGMSLMGWGPFTTAAGSRSISSSTAWRVGRAAVCTAWNGRDFSGSATAGLIAMAVTPRQASARPAFSTRVANIDAARGEKNVATSRARACSAARAESGKTSAARAS